MIDDIKYWKERHINRKGELASVGTKSYSDEANFYIYKILKERYEKLLEKMSFEKEGASVLDAGCGIGLFTDFFTEKGFSVIANDLSEVALEAIKNKNVQKVCSLIKDIPLGSKSVDVVHCFDVLYHVLDDKTWEDSISKLCDVSKKYVIFHERFPLLKAFYSSAHLKVRKGSDTVAVLKNNGFVEVMTTPTHFWANRLFTYKILKYFPKFSYNLDKFTLNVLDKLNITALGSHHIKVFERVEK